MFRWAGNINWSGIDRIYNHHIENINDWRKIFPFSAIVNFVITTFQQHSGIHRLLDNVRLLGNVRSLRNQSDSTVSLCVRCLVFDSSGHSVRWVVAKATWCCFLAPVFSVFRLVDFSFAYISASTVHAFDGHHHSNHAVVPGHRHGNQSSIHMLHHAPNRSPHPVSHTPSPVSKCPGMNAEPMALEPMSILVSILREHLTKKLETKIFS